ncbi:WD40 repeat-like protein [Byssothecium circinans]|uniref:WD40 repeat-like protein n=1 Tax=Byssothecium circinans TaxID=147558 RepID=A0A6A5U3I0_9PLEO|nr:WD40 repeat-like protein [Byssothecium circinans]
MEQLPTPPLSTAPPAIPDTLALPLPNSGHQGWAPSFVDHLSIQDSAAFEDIESFLLYFPAQHLRKTAFLSSDRADQKSAINKEDLDGEKCDFQGMDWTECTSRSNIRSKRAAYERSRLQTKIYEGHGMSHTHQLRNRDNFFSFRRMNTTHRAHCPHFQLRNVMTATSRNDVFYATRDALLRTDAQGSPAVPIINLNKQKVNGNKSQITTLAAQNDVLVAGGFEGDYMITDLTSGLDTRAHFGLIKDWAPDAKSYIANHVHLFPSRSSYAPQAVLCSNDSRLRVLDCMTDTFRYTFAYPSAVNCSATSPDGRMRVVVGDFQETFITNAETGLPFETLSAHVDDAFACAWADDGIHVATAAQDSTIVVWDARFWRRPLTVMPSELSIPRVLKFSPVGSGPRVLIAAEADDYVNIINAQTWDSKQVFDFFGPMAGVSMTPDGQSLFIANTERRFGGLIELERTQWGGTTCAKLRDDAFYDEEYIDWSGDGEMNVDMRVSGGWNERARRGLGLGDLVV